MCRLSAKVGYWQKAKTETVLASLKIIILLQEIDHSPSLRLANTAVAALPCSWNDRVQLYGGRKSANCSRAAR